jgi:hypothetical protein
MAACCCCSLTFDGFRASSALSEEPPRPTLVLPQEIAGTRIPDSKLARDAADYAYGESPLFLFNHCMRAFALSALFAKIQQWSWDEEVVFVASALHDMALLPNFDRPDRTFESAGAAYAEEFATARGMSDVRARVVHDGIARHTVLGEPTDAPSVAMIKIGAGFDVFGIGCGKLSRVDVSSITHAFPRLEFARSFPALLGIPRFHR